MYQTCKYIYMYIKWLYAAFPHNLKLIHLQHEDVKNYQAFIENILLSTVDV